MCCFLCTTLVYDPLFSHVSIAAQRKVKYSISLIQDSYLYLF